MYLHAKIQHLVEAKYIWNTEARCCEMKTDTKEMNTYNKLTEIKTRGPKEPELLIWLNYAFQEQ